MQMSASQTFHPSYASSYACSEGFFFDRQKPKPEESWRCRPVTEGVSGESSWRLYGNSSPWSEIGPKQGTAMPISTLMAGASPTGMVVEQHSDTDFHEQRI